MLAHSTSFTTADPCQLWLEVSQSAHADAWEQSQSFSTLSRRWTAYLNQICLSAFLPWLQEEYPQAKLWINGILPSIWEVVNGTAIAIDNLRLVLIPSHAIDYDELRVPQEWVDIPDWAADYYLAVQVMPDEGCIGIWGFATHEQLKTRSTYESSDRSYCLAGEDLIKDWNTLWVAREFCPEKSVRAAIAPLPNLSLAQAESLIQRLGSPSVALPRLQVPFPLWGALLQHDGWRQQLYERRQGMPEQWSILQWIETGVSNFARQAGWQRFEFQLHPGIPRDIEQIPTSPFLTRHLEIANQSYELRVEPEGVPDAGIWRFELRNAEPDGVVPSGFKLRLLTEDLQPFEKNEATARTAQQRLYLKVALAPGEGLVWEIEPTPENYNIEILRF